MVGFDGLGEGEGVGRDDDVIAARQRGVDAQEEIVGEVFRINDGRTAAGRVGEHLELGANAHVVAIARNAIAHHSWALFV